MNPYKTRNLHGCFDFFYLDLHIKFLKCAWGPTDPPLFSYLIFSRFIIFAFRNYCTLRKIALCIWRKIIFFCHHNFMKKNHSKLSKYEPENISLIKMTWFICKGIWKKWTAELVKLPFWYLLNPLTMCKKGWCVGLGQKEVAWGRVGTVSNNLKAGWSRKEERKNKDFKRVGNLGQGEGGVCALAVV